MKTELICTVCNKTYYKPSKAAKNSKFCSRACFDIKHYQAIPTNKEKQLIYTGILADGSISLVGRYHKYSTNSIHKEYILFKQSLLTNLSYGSGSETLNKGYKRNPIFQFATQSHPFISEVKNSSIESIVKNLDLLGLAIWFYDDGSLHHKKHFYNLNTHSFSYDLQNDVFIPALKDKLDVTAKIAFDRKVDGRVFTYLRINKKEGAHNINTLLSQYPLRCFSYKRFSSEAIPKGSSESET